MNKLMAILIATLLFFVEAAKSQTQFQGSKTGTLVTRGWSVADSGMRAFTPGDTIIPPWLPSQYHAGSTILKSGLPYYFNGSSWVGFSTGGAGITQSVLDDTAAAIRADFPSLTGYMLRSDSTIYASLYRLDTTRSGIDGRTLSNSITSIQDAYFGNAHLWNGTSGQYLHLQNGSSTATAQRALIIDVGDLSRLLTITTPTVSIGGTNTGDQTTITGNAGTATALQTARNIQGVPFDGTANIDIINGTGFVKATGTTLSYDNSTYLTTAAATAGYQPLDADLTTISGLTATTDNFIQSKAGAWASRTVAQVQSDLGLPQTTISGNAATATALQTPRTIGIITGDATSSGSAFDGSANNTNALTLANVNSNVGTFGSATQTAQITTNAKGLVTAASNVTITPAIGNITGLGTGIATALGVNTGSAGAPVLFNGAGGTPSSLTGTNITGTASGLTAGNVTTNANLTGVITSVGNATSTGAQTGTGSTFVMSASPSITGTLTFPTPWTLGATSVTSTGTQLNYLNAATGTTGTTSTNVVFSTSPTLITPTLGVARATSINTGTTLDGIIFAKSATVLSASSTGHALTVGNEASGNNFAIGLYSSLLAIQGRNNGTAQAFYLNPLGGDIVVGDGALTGRRYFAIHNSGSGTGDYAALEVRNGVSGTDALRMYCMGTAWTTSGMNETDYGILSTGTGIAGLAFGTQANGPIKFYTNNTLRWTLDGSGNTIITGSFTSSGGGLGYSTGAGGTVVQGTSRTTTVVNNKLCGTITMFSAAQASKATVTFTLTNSFIAATDFLHVQHISATNGGAWNFSTVCGAGSATITIRNVSAGSITEATPLQFVLIKAVNN